MFQRFTFDLKKHGAIFFLPLLLLTAAAMADQPFPLRLVCGADSLDLGHGEYTVVEYLDLYNDDNRVPVKIGTILADTWVGHKKDKDAENWRDFTEPIIVEPGTTVRIAERQRVVQGYPVRNWWVRWIRFTVETDQGTFLSNFASSPLKRPGKLVYEAPMPKVDSSSGPGRPLKLKRLE